MSRAGILAFLGQETPGFFGSTAGTAGSGGGNLAVPAGAQSGDFALIIAYDGSSLAVTNGGGGWTSLAPTPGGGGIAGFLWKWLDAADLAASPLTVTGVFTAGTPFALVLWRGGYTVTKKDAVSSGSSPTSSAGYVAANGALSIAIFCNDSVVAPSAEPTNFTQRGAFTGAGTRQMVVCDSETYVSNAAISFTWSSGLSASISVLELLQ
jgi:hypothetical protein